MKAESTVIQIIAKYAHLQPSEVQPDTALNWAMMTEINDEVCFALLTNISTMDALSCKTVGHYLSLVQTRIG